MTRQKKVFLALAVVFLTLLMYASYDIATRTTFPGSKAQLKQRIEDQYLTGDSSRTDSTRVR